MDYYHAMVSTIYLALLTAVAAYFSQIVADEKMLSRQRFYLNFFRTIAFSNWFIGLIALILTGIKPTEIMKIFPDGGKSIFLASLVTTFPLNGFYRYFQKKAAHQADQSKSEKRD
ncbi:MAG TPA: hypothetical protein VJZ16_00235 [Syntrophales bacterium]|nr:hypothetical protein [Syntrophales bacterium]